MFGWIHESIRQLIIRKYGAESWVKIINVAKFEEGTENVINHYYKDEETFRLVNATSSVIGIPVEEIWEAYGGFLIQFTMETGWDELLRAMANDLKSFLDNLDALHYFIDHVVHKTRLRGPSFRCETNVADSSIVLHYFSQRSGLYPIVKGVVREIARRVFSMEIIMKVLERKQQLMERDGDAHLEEHVVFHIIEIRPDGLPPVPATSQFLERADQGAVNDILKTSGMVGPTTVLQLTLRDFASTFPHHICFDTNLYVEHCGAYIRRSFPNMVRRVTVLSDLLEIVHPAIAVSYENVVNYINGTWVFRMKPSAMEGISSNKKEEDAVYLKGQMVLLENTTHVIYICSPYVTTVRELINRRLRLSDIPLHDATRDLILLNQSRMSQVELNKRLEETTKDLRKIAVELEQEKEKTDNLLKELLPISVADQLRQGKHVNAGEFQDATVLFADIVRFTKMCSECQPIEVLQVLNDLYSRFDRLTVLNEVYKVETVGDAYMVVGGVPEQTANHAERILNLSLGMLWECKAVKSPTTGASLQVRIGVHSGAVVAGVVGRKMPRYCLFGDTVNTASRMESHGIPSKIHISDHVYKLVVGTGCFVFEERGCVNVKGKGNMFTYFLVRNTKRSLWELVQRPKTEQNTIDGYAELHDVGTTLQIDRWATPTANGLPPQNNISPGQYGRNQHHDPYNNRHDPFVVRAQPDGHKLSMSDPNRNQAVSDMMLKLRSTKRADHCGATTCTML